MTKTPERLVKPWPSLPPLRIDLFVAYLAMGDNWHFTQAEKDRLWQRAGHKQFDGQCRNRFDTARSAGVSMTRQQTSKGKRDFRHGIIDQQFPAVCLGVLNGRPRVWVNGRWRTWHERS